MLITRNDHVWWQFRQFLIPSRHDDDRRDHSTKQPHDALQRYVLDPNGSIAFDKAHACGLASGEDDASV